MLWNRRLGEIYVRYYSISLKKSLKEWWTNDVTFVRLVSPVLQQMARARRRRQLSSVVCYTNNRCGVIEMGSILLRLQKNESRESSKSKQKQHYYLHITTPVLQLLNCWFWTLASNTCSSIIDSELSRDDRSSRDQAGFCRFWLRSTGCLRSIQPGTSLEGAAPRLWRLVLGISARAEKHQKMFLTHITYWPMVQAGVL